MPFNEWNSPLSHLKMRKSILNYTSILCHLDTFHESYSWRTSQPHQPLSVSVAVINLSIPCRLSGAVPLSQFIYTSTLDFTTTPLRNTMDSSFRYIQCFFFFLPISNLKSFLRILNQKLPVVQSNCSFFKYYFGKLLLHFQCMISIIFLTSYCS